jgi:hypothetical protein
MKTLYGDVEWNCVAFVKETVKGLALEDDRHMDALNGAMG